MMPTPPLVHCTEFTTDLDPREIEDATSAAAAWERGHIPLRFATATVTIPEITEWVRSLVIGAVAIGRTHQVPVCCTGGSLLLSGPTGTGKTHQAYGAMRALSSAGVVCSWKVHTAAEIFAQLQPRHGVDTESEFARLLRAHVLVIDDLGAHKGSDWRAETMLRLINARYEHLLPTLITTNEPPKRFTDAFGERIASRLLEMAQTVVILGDDRRRAGIR